MKILMVVEQMLLGGLETHVMTLCGKLISKGHQVFLHLKKCIGPWEEMLKKIGVVFIDSPEKVKEFDLIHLHVWGKSTLDALVWSKQYKKPLVATYHGLYQAYLNVLQECAEIICISPAVKEYLGVPATTIENGIDLNHFKPSPLPLSNTVTWLGRLDGLRWLTLEVLMKATSILGLKMQVVGSFLNPDKAGLLTQYPHITWYGAKIDVAPVIAKSDIVFSTSRGIREAMAAGRIGVVANDIWYGGIVKPDNISQMLENSFMGWNHQYLVEKFVGDDLQWLYEDSQRLQQLAQWSQVYGKQNFSAEKMVEKTERIYIKALLGYSSIVYRNQ